MTIEQGDGSPNYVARIQRSSQIEPTRYYGESLDETQRIEPKLDYSVVSQMINDYNSTQIFV